MTKQYLIEKLYRVERIAISSKFMRMLSNPVKYFDAIIFREVSYKMKKIEREVLTKTFFDTTMHILLPSSTDIYLTGGKSHESETRLAKFLIHHLEAGETFIDVGAHYGYFSLLAAKIVGVDGKIHSFEAAPKTYKILRKNSEKSKNVNAHNFAVSDEESFLQFYEFPNLYSEFNTLEIDQFKKESWFSEHPPIEIKIKSVVLDDFLSTNGLKPKIFKIDVEGAELKVIKGMSNHLTKHSPYVVMEYLSAARGNSEHQEAERFLKNLGFSSHLIDDEGIPKPIKNISQYLEENKLESDNIVFFKL